MARMKARRSPRKKSGRPYNEAAQKFDVLVELINQLSIIIDRTFKGDPEAEECLSDIREICTEFRPMSLTIPVARALEFMGFCNYLAQFVVRAPSNTCCVFCGPILLSPNGNLWGHRKQLEKLMKRHTTLRSLTMRFFLDLLQRDGINGIDERVLKRDLKALDAWLIHNHPELLGSSVHRLDISSLDVSLLRMQSWRNRQRPTDNNNF